MSRSRKYTLNFMNFGRELIGFLRELTIGFNFEKIGIIARFYI